MVPAAKLTLLLCATPSYEPTCVIKFLYAMAVGYDFACCCCCCCCGIDDDDGVLAVWFGLIWFDLVGRGWQGRRKVCLIAMVKRKGVLVR